MGIASVSSRGAVEVERWPSELPLQALCILVSLGIYALLVLSVVGILYALGVALFFFVAHAAFVAHVRGNAVRLGPAQFPDLHRRVLDIAGRIGLEDVPDAYLMQAGGALNAFATRFLGLDVIVLYSDLLVACGDNEAARDMIIAHELGHIKAGHVRLHWLVAPAMVVPFLGTALSRAREYTCDRYGLAGAGDRTGALFGLTVLAAGGRHAPAVNQRALALQREDLNTGWLTIGEWFGGHPTLAKRLAALEPALVAGTSLPNAGRVRALLIVGSFLLVVVAGGVVAGGRFARFMREAERQAALQQQQRRSPGEAGAPVMGARRVADSLAALVDTIVVLYPESIVLHVGRSTRVLDSVRTEGLRASGERLPVYPAWLAIEDTSIAQPRSAGLTGLKVGRTRLVISVMSRMGHAPPSYVPVRVVP